MFYGGYLTQCVTEADAKRWARDHAPCEVVAITEKVNGKIVQSREYELPESEEDASDDDLSLLDPDDIDLDDTDLLNPAIVRAKIENAKLRAQLEAKNAHGGLGELIEGVRFVEEIKRQAAPQKSFVEQVREAKEIVDIVSPRREVNPASAPVPPTVDPKLEALKAIVGDPELREIAKDAALEIIGVKRKGDSDPWAAVADKLLDHPQFPTIAQGAVNAAVNLVGNALSGFASFFAPRQAPAPTQQAPAPQAPAVQPTQQPPQVAPIETPQSLPEAQQQQASQPAPETTNVDPYVGMLTRVITMMANNAPADEAVKTVNGFLLLNPAAGELIDDQFGQDPDTLLGAIATIPGCEQIAKLGHAKSWIEQFQAKFFDEGNGEFDQVTEVDQGEVKL
jgi:hypothetical protein